MCQQHPIIIQQRYEKCYTANALCSPYSNMSEGGIITELRDVITNITVSLDSLVLYAIHIPVLAVP